MNAAEVVAYTADADIWCKACARAKYGNLQAYGFPDSLEPDSYLGRFELIQGAYWAYADYHSGQWSAGYRHLSKLGRHYRPGPLESTASLEGEALAAYVRVAVRLLKERA